MNQEAPERPGAAPGTDLPPGTAAADPDIQIETDMSRELKTLALFATGLILARILVLAVDAIAESLERRSLYS